MPAPVAAVAAPTEVLAVVLEAEPEPVAGTPVELGVCAGAAAVELDPVPLDGVPDVVAVEPVPVVAPVGVVVEVVPGAVPVVGEPVVVTGPLVPVAPGVPGAVALGAWVVVPVLVEPLLVEPLLVEPLPVEPLPVEPVFASVVDPELVPLIGDKLAYRRLSGSSVSVIGSVLFDSIVAPAPDRDGTRRTVLAAVERVELEEPAVLELRAGARLQRCAAGRRRRSRRADRRGHHRVAVGSGVASDVMNPVAWNRRERLLKLHGAAGRHHCGSQQRHDVGGAAGQQPG